jgi:hypothetical protein
LNLTEKKNDLSSCGFTTRNWSDPIRTHNLKDEDWI